MSSRRIGFSHDYPKLYGQTKAKLLEVKLIDRDEIHFAAINYDTVWFDDALGAHYFELDPGMQMRLTLIGDKGVPFTTYRSYTQANAGKYANAVGEEFEIFVRKS